jgi:ABC-type glutathione transport system ATPase component
MMVARLKEQSPIIQVREVDKSFVNQGMKEKILDRVSFDIRRGEIVALLGHT